MENIKFTKKINKKDITDDIKIYIAKKVNMKYNLEPFFIKKDNIVHFLQFNKYKAISYHYSKKTDLLPETEWHWQLRATPLVLKNLINEKINSISGINLFAMIELIQKNSLILCFGDNHTWDQRETLETDKWKYLCGEEKEKKVIDYKDKIIKEDNVEIMDTLNNLKTNLQKDIFITYFILYILKNFKNVHFFIEKWSSNKVASNKKRWATPLFYSKFIWSIFNCYGKPKDQCTEERNKIITTLFNNTCKFHYNDFRNDDNFLYLFLQLLEVPFFLQKKISYKIKKKNDDDEEESDYEDKEFCIYKPYETATENVKDIFLNKIKQLYILFFIQGYKITEEDIKQYIIEEKIEIYYNTQWVDEDNSGLFKYRYPQYKKMMDKVKEGNIFIFKSYTDNIIDQLEFDNEDSIINEDTVDTFRIENEDNYKFKLESRNIINNNWNEPVDLRKHLKITNNYFNILYRLKIQVGEGEGKPWENLNNTNINDEYYYLNEIKKNYHKLVIDKDPVTINLLKEGIIIPIYSENNNDYLIQNDAPIIFRNRYDYYKQLITDFNDESGIKEFGYNDENGNYRGWEINREDTSSNLYILKSNTGQETYIKAIDNITLKYNGKGKGKDEGKDVFNLQINNNTEKNYKLKLLLLTDYIEDKEINLIIKDYFPNYFDDRFEEEYKEEEKKLNNNIKEKKKKEKELPYGIEKIKLEKKIEKLEEISQFGSKWEFNIFNQIITKDNLIKNIVKKKFKKVYISIYKDKDNVDGIHVTRMSKQLLKLDEDTQKKVITFLFDTLLPKFNNDISNENKIIYYEQSDFIIKYYILILFIDFYNICRILYYSNFGNRKFPYKPEKNSPEAEEQEYDKNVKNSICLNWGGENISSMHSSAVSRGSPNPSNNDFRVKDLYLYDEDSYGHNSAVLLFMRNYLYNEEYKKEFLINLKNKKKNTTIIKYANNDKKTGSMFKNIIFRSFPKDEDKLKYNNNIKILKYVAENKISNNSDCVNIFDLE